MRVDLPDVVSGSAASAYHCTSLAAIDRHLNHLRRRLAVDDDPRVRPWLLADVDRLLDYRSMFVELHGEGS